ncbi:MAG: hypothetical protein FWG23_03680 [Eggerthellaceae bacterium]|nr:hypothetical protein [Eggerthellaceae bacterium]
MVVPQPRVQVIPGGRPHSKQLSSTTLFAVRLFAAVLFVFIFLGFVRVGLHAATVETGISADRWAGKVESARAFGHQVESRERYLSNPGYLSTEAAKLKMAEPDNLVVIDLPDDIVQTDGDGCLSLLLSLRVAAQK